jgi:hypothetical protein
VNEETFDWFSRLVADGINHPKTSDWEREFLRSQQDWIDKFGSNTRVSPKQWGVIDRIANAIGFEAKPDVDD